MMTRWHNACDDMSAGTDDVPFNTVCQNLCKMISVMIPAIVFKSFSIPAFSCPNGICATTSPLRWCRDDGRAAFSIICRKAPRTNTHVRYLLNNPARAHQAGLGGQANSFWGSSVVRIVHAGARRLQDTVRYCSRFAFCTRRRRRSMARFPLYLIYFWKFIIGV